MVWWGWVGPVCAWDSGTGMPSIQGNGRQGYPFTHPRGCQSNLAARTVPGLMASTMSSPPSGAKLRPSPSPTSRRSVPGPGPRALRGTHWAFLSVGGGSPGLGGQNRGPLDLPSSQVTSLVSVCPSVRWMGFRDVGMRPHTTLPLQGDQPCLFIRTDAEAPTLPDVKSRLIEKEPKARKD